MQQVKMGGFRVRPANQHVPHAVALAPDYIDFIDAYTNVSSRPGRSPVLFAYRQTPCPDWNRQNPSKLFTGNVIEAMLASIPRGQGVILDIGACYGDTAVPMGALLGDRVIAFEPNPKSFAVLDYNAKMNPGLNIEAHNVAAAGDETTTYLDFAYAGDMCNGGVAMKEFEFQKKETHVRVAATYIPGFLIRKYGEEIFDQITFIKIDAEGFDAFILRTLKPILKRNPKIILMVEWFDHYFTKDDPEGIHPRSQELFDTIGEMGYDIYEPYSMTIIKTPQNKFKTPDVTLLPKGTVAWKPFTS